MGSWREEYLYMIWRYHRVVAKKRKDAEVTRTYNGLQDYQASLSLGYLLGDEKSAIRLI